MTRTSIVHNYSMTYAHILGNDCPQFGKLLQDCIKLLHRHDYLMGSQIYQITVNRM